QIFRLAFVLRGGSARDHFQIGDACELGQDFILNAVGKVSGVLVVAQIFEWQHRNRFLGNCSRPGASRIGVLSRRLGRVTTEEKQTDRKRRANDYDKNPNVLSWLQRRRRHIDLFRSLDSLRGEFKCPRDDERNRKSYRDEDDHQSNDPIRNLEKWKDLRRNLN